MTTCQAKHTMFQPSMEQWRCPKCQAKADDGFCIYDPVDGTEDCDKLHPGDGLACSKCRYETTGRAFAARVQKAAKVVCCPTCKGRGTVPDAGVTPAPSGDK